MPRSRLILPLAMIGMSLTAGAAGAAPLPRSDFAVRPACAAPSPGRASCLALGLEPINSAVRARVHPHATANRPQTGLVSASECSAYPSSCLTPQQLNDAYFPGLAAEAPSSEPQTIALVDAYNDLNAEADLNVYDEEFKLPACTTADGCFQKVGVSGSPTTLPFPKSQTELETYAKGTKAKREKAEEAEGWALETATDVEVAHAVCRNCHILLVEANGPEYSELGGAEDAAVTLHATEVSNSWGGQESGTDYEAFNHPGVVITAAAGDDGYLNWDQYPSRAEAGSPYFEGADYPAASPHVISVGGTHLNLDAGGAWESESPWNSEGAGGSGCSGSLAAPVWQRDVSDWAQVGCGANRANADIAADADPSTGVNVYDSTPYPSEEEGKKLIAVPNWVPIGGTSVASPIVASMFALAGGAHGVAYPAQTLYSHLGSSTLHDVASGGDGECDGNYSTGCGGSLASPLDCGESAWICNATGGYDGPTGVGTPDGIGAFKPLEGSEEAKQTSKLAEEAGKSSGGGGPLSGPNGSGSASSGGSSSSNGGGTGQAGTHATAPAVYATRLSALTLTANARIALRASHLPISALAFSCTLSHTANVRVALAMSVHTGGRARWHTLPVSFTFAAAKGVNRRRLHGERRLPPGVYRLTLTPVGGSARSITIRVV